MNEGLNFVQDAQRYRFPCIPNDFAAPTATVLSAPVSNERSLLRASPPVMRPMSPSLVAASVPTGIVIVATLMACQARASRPVLPSPAPQTAPSVGPAAAPLPAPLRSERIPDADRARLAEAFRLGDQFGEKFWPDWNGAPFAVLLVTEAREYLIRHSAPTPDFVRIGFHTLLHSDVYARPRVFAPTAAQTRVARARVALEKAIPADASRYLAFQMWREGIARYTELQFAKLGATDFTVSPELRAMTDFTTLAVEADALEREAMSGATAVLSRDRRTAFYPVGASVGLWLDRVRPAWRERYFTGPLSLDALMPQ